MNSYRVTLANGDILIGGASSKKEAYAKVAKRYPSNARPMALSIEIVQPYRPAWLDA